MGDLIVAVGIALAIEGTLYAAFPNAARRMAASVSAAPERALRIGGLAALVIGVVLVWLIRG